MNTLKYELKDYKVLLRNVPSMVITVFVLSVVCMNLMAGKELYSSKYFCINSGLALSWISFLCMDCICKRFGARAAVKISILAMAINVVTVGIFKLLSLTPGRWAAYYSTSDAATGDLINSSLNSTFGSAWYIVLGSALAMILSSVVNSYTNEFIGKKTDKGTYGNFALRSFISTAAGQWVDNFVFSAMVSHVFFGWNWTQVLICATTSMIIELTLEAIFSPVGFKVSKSWEENGVGQDYLNAIS